MKRSTQFRDLKSYKWKPGFEEIKDNKSDNDGNYLSLMEESKFDKSINEESTRCQPKKLLLLSEEEEDSLQTQKQLNNGDMKGDNNLIS